MVRTYKQRNRYCRNCKLSEEQFLSILGYYLRFEPPRSAAEELGLPRQTIGAHYLKIGKYLANSPIAGSSQPPFVDSSSQNATHLAWMKSRTTKTREKYLRKLWDQCYVNFSRGISREIYQDLRARDREPIDKHVWWLVCDQLWAKWGRIPKSSFRYHFALVRLTTHAREAAARVLKKSYDPAFPAPTEIAEYATRTLQNGIALLLRTRPL